MEQNGNVIKNFDAKSNDIFCLGVCLFMVCSVFLLSPSMFPFNYILFVHILQIIIGSAPWSTSASMNDPAFECIVDGNLEYLSVICVTTLSLVN